MRVWLLKDGEHLPIQTGVSKMRTWMLAEALADRGHEIVWWSSNHSHQLKSQLTDGDLDTVVDPGFRLTLLDCGGYEKNRSLARYRHHRRLAARFLEAASNAPRPDLILASFPTIEFAAAGCKVGHRYGVPTVLDIRDPWPDVAYNLHNGIKEQAAKALLYGLDRQARSTLGRADALVACSKGFLDWGLQKAARERGPRDGFFYIGRSSAIESAWPDELPWLAHLPDECKILSFVGAFGQVYELELICAAAKRFLDGSHSDVHFVLAGDGDKDSRIRELAAELPNVTMPGWISANEVQTLLRRSIAGLAPYRQLPGCVPNKAVEYLASGLPVVSSLEGDFERLLAGYSAGYSYTPGHLDGLVGCLRDVIAASSAGRPEAPTRLFEREFKSSEIYPHFVSHLEAIGSAGANNSWNLKPAQRR